MPATQPRFVNASALRAVAEGGLLHDATAIDAIRRLPAAPRTVAMTHRPTPSAPTTTKLARCAGRWLVPGICILALSGCVVPAYRYADVTPAYRGDVQTVIPDSRVPRDAVPMTRLPPPVYDGDRTRRTSPSVQARWGTVERIVVEERRAEGTGGGALLGALIGGVVGHQIGGGDGRAAATALGAFGGAVVGDQIEQQQADALSQRRYRVSVRFDDGAWRDYVYDDLRGLRVGDRVRWREGALRAG